MMQVSIPQLYFGLPYFDIDGNVVYTRITAKNISADAINLAEYDMREHFKKNQYLTSSQLQNYWVERTLIRMKELTSNKGRTSRTGTINSLNQAPPIPYNACD
jgi:hypothetical protein